jgi:hypothetical protein
LFGVVFGIWKARQILLIGCRWSICDGDKINIMKDLWLCGSHECLVPFSEEKNVYHLTVKDLLLDSYKA